MKIERILVGLDTSPRAREVLDSAVGLARTHLAKLILFRGVGLQPDLPSVVYASPDDLGKQLVDHALDELDEIARTVPPELLEGVFVEIGTPWQSICHAAREKGVDLVVIGSHGYNVLDRVLGTTAAKVVNHADRAVLVVRCQPTPKGAGAPA